MTKQFSNYSDLITFTRASGGHALRPVSYGDELVTNGTFDTDSDWEKSSHWTISGGEANHPSSGTYYPLQQQLSLTSSKVYKITLDITSITSGTLAVYLRNPGVSSTELAQFTTTGSKTIIVVANANEDYLAIHRYSGTTLAATIDNVSVKEVTFDQPDGTLILFEHPNDVPRVEWDSAGNRLGLLVEEARTNLVPYSEFSSGWGATRSTLTANAVVSPDRASNGSSIKASTDSNDHYISDTLSVTATNTYTASVFAKAGGKNWFWIWNGSASTYFDLTSGVVGTVAASNNTSAEIKNLGNGWYKCSITFDAASSSYVFALGPAEADSDSVYVGDNSTEEIYIYGAQLEAGSFPTSYIKTTGSTATRSADVASIPVADFGFNADEGTVVCQVQHFTTESSTAHAPFGFDDGTSNNRMWYYQNKGQWIGSVSGSTTFSVDATDPTEGVETKVGVTYKKDDFTLYLNGSSIGTDTSSNVPVVDTMGIGRVGASGTELNGHIKSIKYYPRRLTNAQLQDLTS